MLISSPAYLLRPTLLHFNQASISLPHQRVFRRASASHSAGKTQLQNKPNCGVIWKLLQRKSFSFQYSLRMKWHYSKLRAHKNWLRNPVIKQANRCWNPKERGGILDNHSGLTPPVAIISRILINLTTTQNDRCYRFINYNIR